MDAVDAVDAVDAPMYADFLRNGSTEPLLPPKTTMEIRVHGSSDTSRVSHGPLSAVTLIAIALVRVAGADLYRRVARLPRQRPPYSPARVLVVIAPAELIRLAALLGRSYRSNLSLGRDSPARYRFVLLLAAKYGAPGKIA